ncbi:MAG: sigma-70 family RNA polymerase sigma factor [Terrimicrobiaceae bacterium]|nr:sigma-70 family RNA polymerase sigma factor [Terrimicrobiaceae bacterium]
MSEAREEGGEARLLSLARAGDSSAFDELVTAHRDKVYMQAYLICRNPDDAMDLCQETFLRAWRALGAFDGRQPLAAWLRRIVTNAAIDWCRRRGRQGLVEMAPEAGHPPPGTPGVSQAFERPGLSLERRELAQRIESAFLALNPEQRAAVAMRDVEGLSYREIAAALGCTVGTVMSRLFYGRKKLQALLADLRP